jgi:hypothetical protein
MLFIFYHAFLFFLIMLFNFFFKAFKLRCQVGSWMHRQVWCSGKKSNQGIIFKAISLNELPTFQFHFLLPVSYHPSPHTPQIPKVCSIWPFPFFVLTTIKLFQFLKAADSRALTLSYTSMWLWPTANLGCYFHSTNICDYCVRACRYQCFYVNCLINAELIKSTLIAGHGSTYLWSQH